MEEARPQQLRAAHLGPFALLVYAMANVFEGVVQREDVVECQLVPQLVHGPAQHGVDLGSLGIADDEANVSAAEVIHDQEHDGPRSLVVAPLDQVLVHVDPRQRRDVGVGVGVAAFGRSFDRRLHEANEEPHVVLGLLLLARPRVARREEPPGLAFSVTLVPGMVGVVPDDGLNLELVYLFNSSLPNFNLIW